MVEEYQDHSVDGCGVCRESQPTQAAELPTMLMLAQLIFYVLLAQFCGASLTHCRKSG